MIKGKIKVKEHEIGLCVCDEDRGRIGRKSHNSKDFGSKELLPSYQSRKLANFTWKNFNPTNKKISRDF